MTEEPAGRGNEVAIITTVPPAPTDCENGPEVLELKLGSVEV